MQKELKEKQKKELDELESLEEEVKEKIELTNLKKQKEEEEIEKQKKKQEKNKKKDEKKKKKDEEQRKKAEEALMNGGDRQREINLIQKQLNDLGLLIKVVPSDGHCLFRSVSDQIDNSKDAHLKLRKLVAKEMRSNPNDYIPFLETSNGDLMGEKEFEEYCNNIENTSCWGGQCEIKSLVNILQKQITIFQADAPVIKMGEEFCKNGEIYLTYHRFFYSLGEHYNSVQKK